MSDATVPVVSEIEFRDPFDVVYHREFPWTVGDTLFPATSTIAPVASYEPFTAPCAPSGQFRCLANNGTDDQGYTYFEYCEPASDYPPDSTIAGITDFASVDSTIEVIATTTTSIELAPNTTILGVAANTTDVAPTTTS